MRRGVFALFAVAFVATAPVPAAVITYGDKDVLNGQGTYPIDPTTGATLQGLAPNAVTFGQPELNHNFPFTPSGGDFPGTDQIYVGSSQTAFLDGYSGSSRLNGPQVLTLNYSSLVPAGSTVQSLTLGIAADDFQFPVLGQPFTASINGVTNVTLTNTLNGLEQSGPQVQFFTIGIAPGSLLPSNVLTLTINEGGNGGDGWAVDFLTIGVVTAVPEPTTIVLFAAAAVGGLGLRRNRGKRAA